MSVISVEMSTLDHALPMALLFEACGTVTHVGPTFEKIAPGAVGKGLAGVMNFVHPQFSGSCADVLRYSGRKLRVELRHEANIPPGEGLSTLRGTVVPLSDRRGLINLALGADPGVALKRHRLTARDFTATDPMVDFLYLIEAHAMVLSEFERLSERLDQARSAAEEAAVTDKLTGLRNRRAMDDHLGRLTVGAGPAFGLMNIDLDYFKSVNDTMGHAAGDRVLEEVARILRQEVRSGDMVARVGGDEFMLLFENCADVGLLQQIAGRIIQRLEVPIDWQGQECRISASIGITMSSYYDTLDAERLVSDADSALYASKRAGRARHSVARPMGECSMGPEG
ncbi:GGDEF domain-containing protein [Jannaschia helgolandensis]|uniref:GGDEF domain-containing protein n=1 Tax=Jannaschia helgolandensis TaxID=188906 RepID=UPI0030DC97E0|tara:strand:+ start:3911 stop:4930 length:1020 start_codon:yes stop_codon:yes gene_type:complete